MWTNHIINNKPWHNHLCNKTGLLTCRQWATYPTLENICWQDLVVDHTVGLIHAVHREEKRGKGYDKLTVTNHQSTTANYGQDMNYNLLCFIKYWWTSNNNSITRTFTACKHHNCTHVHIQHIHMHCLSITVINHFFFFLKRDLILIPQCRTVGQTKPGQWCSLK